MPQLRQHKAFSEIEGDIRRYYDDGTVDAGDTALKVAVRAVSVFAWYIEPIDRELVDTIREQLATLLERRQLEQARQTFARVIEGRS